MEEDELADVRIVFDDEHAPRGFLGGSVLRCHRPASLRPRSASRTRPFPLSPIFHRAATAASRTGRIHQYHETQNPFAHRAHRRRDDQRRCLLFPPRRNGDRADHRCRHARRHRHRDLRRPARSQAVTTVQVGSQVSGIDRVADGRFQLDGPQGPGAGDARPVHLFVEAVEQAQASLVSRRSRGRTASRRADGRRHRARPRARARGEAAAAGGGPAESPRRRPSRRRPRSSAPTPRSTQARSGVAQSQRQPGEDRHHLADRRRRHRAQRGRGTDRRGELLRAHAVRHRRGSLRHAGQRQHRRVRLGQVRAGQPVTFRVDAYPSETFAGRVRRCVSNPTTVQNVVTYSTIIDAPNPALQLKPGHDGQRHDRGGAA